MERRADADAVAGQLKMLRDQHQQLEEQRGILKVLAPVDGVVHHVMDPAAPITIGSTVRGGQALSVYFSTPVRAITGSGE